MGNKKLVYESTTCSRCLGSGKYSWNAFNGDTCFKCRGVGRTLTKRAEEARRQVLASVRKLEVMVTDLVAGDKIRQYHENGSTFDVVEVLAVELGGWFSESTGQRFVALTLRDKEGKVTVDGTTYNSANIVRRAHRTEAEFATMREVASRFPGAVTIPE